MPVKKGDKIKVEYTGTLTDGTVFDTNVGKDALEFEVGSGQLIKGFDEGVVGMNAGEEKEISIKSEDAYGAPNPQMVQKVPKDKIPKEPEAKVGMTLMVGLPTGQQLPARITEVTEEHVTIDLNHPLAGKNLKFKVKILE